MSQQKWFITFGGPSENYHNAVTRICSEARSTNIFNNIIGYTENDLISDTPFWDKHGDFISNHKRGMGIGYGNHI